MNFSLLVEELEKRLTTDCSNDNDKIVNHSEKEFEYLSERLIIEQFNWKKEWIAQYLGKPDKTMPHRKNKKIKIPLYSVARIKEIDAQLSTQKESIEANNESVIEDVCIDYEALIKTLPIVVHRYDWHHIINDAKWWSNQHGFIDKVKLKQTVMNYLSHNCVDYDNDFLDDLYNHKNYQELSKQLNTRLQNAIKKVYPELK